MSDENGRVEHKDLAEALSAFQAEVPVFVKDKTATVRMKAGGTYTYKYADLGDILPIVNPLLAKHGLSWSSQPGCTDDGTMVLRFTLRHVGGGTDEGWVPLILGDRYGVQDVGSALTYMRRYAMTAQLNIATDEDDGGQAAQQTASRSAQAPPPTPDVASDTQRSQILAAGAEMKLPSSALANVMLIATENDPRVWASEEEARSWVANALKRLPAESVEKVIAAIEAPE